MDCGSPPSSDPRVFCCPKQQMCNLLTEEEVVILTHPRIPDVLLLPVNGPRYARNVWSAGRTHWKTLPFNALLSQLLGRCLQGLETVRERKIVVLTKRDECHASQQNLSALSKQNKFTIQTLVIEKVHCSGDILRVSSESDHSPCCCQVCGAAQLRGCCRRSVWQRCSERSSRLLPRDHRLPKV